MLGGTDHSNALFMMEWTGFFWQVMGRKRFSWIMDVKWRKYCVRQKLNPSKMNRS